MTVASHAARRTGAEPKPQKRHACVPCSERGLDACPHVTKDDAHRHASSFDDHRCLAFLRAVAVHTPMTASETSRHQRAVFGGQVAAAYLTRPIVSQRDGVSMTFEPAEAAWPVVAIMNELVAERPRDYSLQWLRLAIVLDQSPAQIARSFRKSESDVARGLNAAAIRVCRDDLPVQWLRDRDAIRLSPAKCNCRRAQRGEDCGHTTDRVVAEGGRTPAHWRWYYGASATR